MIRLFVSDIWSPPTWLRLLWKFLVYQAFHSTIVRIGHLLLGVYQLDPQFAYQAAIDLLKSTQASVEIIQDSFSVTDGD